MHMKILNFGSCNIDYVYSLEHIVKVGETQTTSKMEIFPGGKGLNQSIALARAGSPVYHAGCIGNDGQMLFEIMNESGVNTDYVKRVDATNGHAIIQVSSCGENSIFLYPGSNNMITREYVDDVLKDFTKDDILLLQNEINEIEYIVDKAYDKGIKIVLNPSPFNDIISRLDLCKITYLILNEVEAYEYSGYEDSEKSLEYFSERYPLLKVMLTLGSKGCVFMESGRKTYHSIFDVNAVDTTAAGDTFTGYFIEGISNGNSIEDILRTASAASAITVSAMGAAVSIPSKETVLTKLPQMKEKY